MTVRSSDQEAELNTEDKFGSVLFFKKEGEVQVLTEREEKQDGISTAVDRSHTGHDHRCPSVSLQPQQLLHRWKVVAQDTELFV